MSRYFFLLQLLQVSVPVPPVHGRAGISLVCLLRSRMVRSAHGAVMPVGAPDPTGIGMLAGSWGRQRTPRSPGVLEGFAEGEGLLGSHLFFCLKGWMRLFDLEQAGRSARWDRSSGPGRIHPSPAVLEDAAARLLPGSVGWVPLHPPKALPTLPGCEAGLGSPRPSSQVLPPIRRPICPRLQRFTFL